MLITSPIGLVVPAGYHLRVVISSSSRLRSRNQTPLPSHNLHPERRTSVWLLRDGSTLDSTSMRGPPTAAAATSAGETADDDAEEGDDGVDDGLETGGDGINNRHDAVADRSD